MCTVTIVPGPEATVRLACNRDELRTRPPALPPRVRRFGKHRAILPIDPVSQGTWIAVHDTGWAMTLLNVNGSAASGTRRIPPWSRGSIIPALLHCETMAAATQLAAALMPRNYAPFRLVIFDRRHVAVLFCNGRQLQLRQGGPLTGPTFFTSSGLGDDRVEGPRRQLFESFFSRKSDLLHQQDAFHRHSWPEQAHLSVCMRRPDARTVSHTLVSIGPDAIALTYYPDAPDQAVRPLSMTLDQEPGGAP